MNKTIDNQQQKKFTYHYFFEHVSAELKDVEAFINSTDKFLAENSQINNQSLANDEEMNSRFHPNVQFGSIFPSILWRTTFLHCYFRLESLLDHVCKNLQLTENYTLSISDISGNGIFKASIYLKKVCDIKAPFTDNVWARLVDYNKLRNIFVHSDGIVSHKIAVGLAMRNEGLLVAIIDYDRLEIGFSKEFTLKALNTIRAFFDILHKAMLEKLNSNP